MSAFKDHFSTGSAGYAANRPTYPDALVDALAAVSPGTALALDCGCGTGQLSGVLARRFGRVVATDASAAQIAAAEPFEAVEYRVAPAEASGLDAGSVDLLTVAQAAHWFDLDAFYGEARRVLRPGGVLALVTYGVIEADPEVAPVIDRFYWRVAGPHWPPERRHVEEGYRSLSFPFPEIDLPRLAILCRWDLKRLAGYVDTWSAVKALARAEGPGPVERFRAELLEAWGDPGRVREIRFPLSVRAGRAG